MSAAGTAARTRARAAVLVAPGSYEIRTFPIPDPPAGGAILRVDLAGICGTDKHTFQGDTSQYGGSLTPRSTRFPLIQGHEIVGTLDAIGRGGLRAEDGTSLAVGDRVVLAPNLSCGACEPCRRGWTYTLCDRTEDYGNSLSAADPPHLLGGWAEAMVVLPGSHLFRVPAGLRDALAVLTEPLAVTVGLDAVAPVETDPDLPLAGLSVVVYGVGPLGLCHVLRAAWMGADRIVVIDRSAPRLAFARRLGATLELDTTATTEHARRTAVLDLTAGRGADIVVEAAGVPEVVPEAIDLVRPGGSFVAVGNFADLGPVALSPHRHFVSKGIHLVGVPGDDLGRYGPMLAALDAHRDDPALADFTAERYPLAEAPLAMASAMRPGSLKVVIDPTA